MRYLLLLITVLFFSCDYSYLTNPVEVESIQVSLGGDSDFEKVGLRIKVSNLTETDIEEYRLSFFLFDSRGNQMPSLGNNYFDTGGKFVIPAGESVELTVNLDEAFSSVPSNNLVVDTFHFYWIKFKGGEVWEDKYGNHYYEGSSQ